MKEVIYTNCITFMGALLNLNFPFCQQFDLKQQLFNILFRLLLYFLLIN